jgi:glyoxylase-like metal-dependent hydrolase (beta-lactamase superfamily II)
LIKKPFSPLLYPEAANLTHLVCELGERQKMITRREILGTSAALLAGSIVPATAEAAAPMLGIKPSNVHRYKMGDFEVTAIRDGQVTLDKPWQVFGENQTEETVRKLARRLHLPEDKHTITFTPVIVNTGKEVVLFDTGWGAGNPGRGELAGSLAAAGYTLDQIDVVVLTHCHPDHMGGLMDGDKPVFPKARYVAGETEYNFWSNAAQDAGGTKDFYQLTKAKLTPLAAKTTFVKGEASVATGITAMETHGHTPGHMSYRIESNGVQAVVSGDVCNHSVLSMQKPNWHVLFDMDKDTAVKTRNSFLDMLAKDKIALIDVSVHDVNNAVDFFAKKTPAETPGFIFHVGRTYFFTSETVFKTCEAIS